MLFKEIEYNSGEYRQALELRTELLRTPLGKELSSFDKIKEEEQLHFGVFNAGELVACVIVKPIGSGSSAKLRQMAVAHIFKAWVLVQNLF